MAGPVRHVRPQLRLLYDELLESAFGPRPGPLWQQAEELALLLGVVPVAFRLATIALEDAARAKASGKEVAALCREIAAPATGLIPRARKGGGASA